MRYHARQQALNVCVYMEATSCAVRPSLLHAQRATTVIVSPYCGGILVLTSMCTTISAGSPPTAIIPGVGFLENVANFIVRDGKGLLRLISSAPGTRDTTFT